MIFPTKTVALVLTVFFSASAAELWKHDAPDDVKWMHVTFAGGFVYGTDSGLYALDPTSGKVLWKREDLKKVPEAAAEEIDGTPVMLVAQNTGAIKLEGVAIGVDLTNGQTLWQTDKVKGMVVDIVPVYAKGLVVVVTAASGGKSSLELLALNIATGAVKWQAKIDDKADLYVAEKSSRFFPKFDLKGHARPVADESALYLPYAGIHKVNLDTGAVVWKSAYDVTEKAFVHANADPIVAGNFVYTSAKGVIRAFNKQSGALQWTSADYGTGVAQLELNGGVLYGRMGGVFQDANSRAFVPRKPLGVVALDAASGQLKWRYEGAEGSVTNMLVSQEAGALLIADGKNLIGLSLDASGNKVKEAYKVPLEFKPKGSGGGMKAAKIGFGALRGGAIGAIRASGNGPAEPPIALVPRSNGLIVIRGTQHLLAFDPAKKEIAWSARIDSPGLSTFNKIATISTYAMIYTAYTAQAASTYRGTSENDWANENRFRTMQQWDAAVARRYHKTNSSADYVYMLSDVKTADGKGPGIVGVNLSTGEQERLVYFGDREPEYVADEIDGLVFRTHKNGKTIYALEASR